MKRFSILMVLVLSISLLVACGSSNIDRDIFKSISGDYQAVAQETGDPNGYVGDWWHLYIGDDEEHGAYLAIYDNAAGNPGVEGPIYALDDSTVKIKCDPDLTDQLPSSEWEPDGDYLEMTYTTTDSGIILENSGKAIEFKKDVNFRTLCGNWKSDAEQSLDNFSFTGRGVQMTGWNYECSGQENVGGIWCEETLDFELADDCSFTDNFFMTGDVTQGEWEELIRRDDAGNSVIELDVSDETVIAIRLSKIEDTELAG